MIKFVFPFIINCILSVNLLTGQDLFASKSENSVIITESPSKLSATFQFKAYSKEFYLESISNELAGSHPFGDLIAKKIYLFEEYYTYEENPFPGNPAVKTIIKKPVIYSAVKDIEKDLKKSVKKGITSVTEASIVMNSVLDVALNIVTADTKSFENSIKVSESIVTKRDLFTRKVKLIY